MISLIVIVVLVYISQAAQLLNPDAIVFRPGIRRWKLATPAARFAGLGKVLYLGLLVPPLRGLLVTTNPKVADKNSFKVKEGKRRLRHYRVLSLWPRTFANLLFIFLVVFLPIGLVRYPIALVWKPLLLELVLMQVACAVTFWFSHRRLVPLAGGDRFSHTLTVLLSPIAALRMDDVLLKDLMKDLHPVVIARLVLPDAEALKFADREVWRQKQARNETDMLEGFIQKQFGSTMPERTAHSQIAVAYCPICDAEYTSLEQACTDCQAPLREFRK